MKGDYWLSFYSLLFMLIFISEINACDVMGSRACGEKPEKEDQELDPVKYCTASRVYFECVHKKYRGCENKEKYEVAMESMIKGIRKRVDDLLAFCTDKIEGYKFHIIWEPPKQAQASDSVRNGRSYAGGMLPKNGILGSQPVQTSEASDGCQVKTINGLCQPLMITTKFNPAWTNLNKRHWCQQATTYFRCLKSRLDKCFQTDIQKQFQSHEYYLHTQININCPGGVNGCTRHSTDARFKSCFYLSNASSAIFRLTYIFLQMGCQLLLLQLF